MSTKPRQIVGFELRRRPRWPLDHLHAQAAAAMILGLHLPRQRTALDDRPANADRRGLVEHHGNNFVLRPDIGQNPELSHHPALLAEDGGLNNVEHTTMRPEIVDRLGKVFSSLIIDLALEDRNRFRVCAGSSGVFERQQAQAVAYAGQTPSSETMSRASENSFLWLRHRRLAKIAHDRCTGRRDPLPRNPVINCRETPHQKGCCGSRHGQLAMGALHPPATQWQCPDRPAARADLDDQPACSNDVGNGVPSSDLMEPDLFRCGSMDLRFRLGKAREDTDRMPDRLRIEARLPERCPDRVPMDMFVPGMMLPGGRVVIMMVWVIVVMVVIMVMDGSVAFRFFPVAPDTEAMTGQDPVIVVFHGYLDLFQQRTRCQHLAQLALQIRAQIEECGNEHIASHAPERIDVDFGHRASALK